MADEERLGVYTLKKRIGRGGMAEVLRATAPDGTDVVVKRMLPHLVEEPQYVKMFLREARIAARLNHENVVRLLDVDKDGETLYLVFDLVDGVTLYELARRAWRAERPMPAELCIRAVADAAIGLHHAHELKDDSGAPSGLVHRDVSPDNLMIDTNGITRVLDFGIAKLDDAASRVSKTGEMRGKLAFMSPEQAQGLALDRRSDLFSLGTTLFWLLTAQKPFGGRTDILTLRALLEQEAPVPTSVNPRIPKAINPIMRRLLDKDPAGRFATGAELHAALVAMLPKDEAPLREMAGAFVAEISALVDKPSEGTQIAIMPTVPSAAVMLLDVDAAKKEDAHPSRAPIYAASAIAVVAIAAGAWFGLSTSSKLPHVDAHDAGTAHDVTATVDAAHGHDAGASLDPARAHDAGTAHDVGTAPADAAHAHDDATDAGDANAAVPPDPAVRDEALDVPLQPFDATHPAARTKRVRLKAPAGVSWRAHTRGDVAEVSLGSRSIAAVDGNGGQHEVPIVDGKADFAALPKGTVRVWLPPTGGEVFLGGKSLGQAPIKPLELPVGKYKLKAKSAEKTEELSVVVVAGQNAPIRFFAH